MAISELLTILNAAPTATRLIGHYKRAMAGDPAALEYLRSQGIFEAADLLKPGAGTAIRHGMEQIQEAVQTVGRGFDPNFGAIDAEYTVLEDEDEGAARVPWSRYASWLRARRWGTFVVLGPKGQGKTMLALRLAQVWHESTGYPVDGVNLYPEDTAGLSWMRNVSMKVFAARMKKLTLALEGPDPDEPEAEPGDEELEQEPPIDIDSMRRRIVIIDEASLVLQSGAASSGRLTARRAMAQARHLDWLVIYIGQLAQMMPLDMLLAESVFVKQPQGWESVADRDDKLTQMLWADATEAFKGVRSGVGWPDYPDVRAWAYVDCRDCGRGRPYQGLVPFGLPTRGEPDRGSEP